MLRSSAEISSREVICDKKSSLSKSIGTSSIIKLARYLKLPSYCEQSVWLKDNDMFRTKSRVNNILFIISVLIVASSPGPLALSPTSLFVGERKTQGGSFVNGLRSKLQWRFMLRTIRKASKPPRYSVPFFVYLFKNNKNFPITASVAERG